MSTSSAVPYEANPGRGGSLIRILHTFGGRLGNTTSNLARRYRWLEDIVEKLIWKHDVDEHEVIEVLENGPVFRRMEGGFKPGEDVYAAFGRTNSDRLLSVFFVYTLDGRAIIVSARDMTPKERSTYAT